MLKSISKLAFANIIGQALQFLTLPLLAYIFAPESFGIFAQVISISTILSVIINLQIHNSIVLSDDSKEFEAHLMAGTTAVLCFTIFAIIITATGIIINQLEFNSCALILASIALTATSCQNNIMKGGITAKGDFRSLANFIVLRSIVLITAQVTIGVLNASAIGLVAGAACAEAASLAYLLKTQKIMPPLVSIRAGITSFRNLARKYPDTIKAGTFQEIASTSAFMLPAYLIGLAYGNAEAGQFAMAQRIVWAPCLLIAQSTTPIIYKYAAQNISQLWPQLKTTTWLLTTLITLVGVVLAFITLDEILNHFLASNWTQAASIAPWIGLWAISFLASLYFRVCYRALRQQKLQLIQDVVTIFALFAVSFSKQLDFAETSRALTIIGIGQNLSYIAGATYMIRRGYRESR